MLCSAGMHAKHALASLGIGAILGAGLLSYATNRTAPGTRVDLSGAAVVVKVRELGRLETASFTIEKIIEAGKDGSAFRNLLFGDKLLLVAHGEVVAGVDLADVAADDVDVDGATLRLTLPKAEVLHVRLDNEKTRVFDRRQGLLARADKDLESEARLAAEQAIKSAACGSDVLGVAAENATKQLKALFTALGFVTVIIEIPPAQC